MPLYFNGNKISDLYFGGTKIGQAWFNGQQVYSSVPPSPYINYIFRDIDENGNLTLATGELEDASGITSIGNKGLYYAFYNCTRLTGSVSFPNLTSIDRDGLSYAFRSCIGLTGSVSFPNLTSIGTAGLYYAFSGCTGLTGSILFPNLTSIDGSGLNFAFSGCTRITEVHFKASLSGNSQCTSSNMGCTNATVYFDL